MNKKEFAIYMIFVMIGLSLMSMNIALYLVEIYPKLAGTDFLFWIGLSIFLILNLLFKNKMAEFVQSLK